MPSIKEVEEARERLVRRVAVARAAASQLRELEMKLAAYDAVLSDLKAISNGHEATTDLLDEAPEPIPAPGTPISALVDMTRGEAIKEVLRRYPGISPATIVGFLTQAGRENDDTHKVSNELGRLQRKKLVRRRGTGRWFLVDPA